MINCLVPADPAPGFGFSRLFELREPGARRRGVGADPAVVDVLDRHRVEVIPAFAPAAFGDDQPRIFQHFEMLHDSASVDVAEVAAQRARGERLILERVEDLASDVRCQGFENLIIFCMD